MGDALHVHGGVTDAREARLAQAGLLAVQGPTVLDARTGVIHGPGTLTLVTGTATTAPMTVNVAPHQWLTSRGAPNGPYLGMLEASTAVSIAAAPASGSRTDVVYVKQQDATAGIPAPDATTAPQYAAVTGTVGQGKPALPVGAEELATVTVAAGATATNGAGIVITNTARQTGLRGAPVPLRNQAEQDALAGYPGLEAYRIDTGQLLLCTAAGPPATWVATYDPVAANRAPRGYLTRAVPNGTAGTNGSYQRLSFTPSATLAAGRRITHRVQQSFYAVSLQNITVRIMRYLASGGGGVLVADRIIGVGGPAPNDVQLADLFIDETPPAGSYIWQIEAMSNLTSNMGYIAAGTAVHVVEDIGAA